MYRQDAYPDTLDFANVRNYRIIFATPCQGVLFVIVFLCGLRYTGTMTNLAFDTHTAVKRLITAGMPDEQAESIVETLRESREFDVSHLATKMDLNKAKSELKAEIIASETKLDKKIDKVEAGLKADIATLDKKIDNVAATLDKKIDGVKPELKADIATLDRKIDGVEGRLELLKRDLTIRLGGMMVAGIAVVAALVEVL